MNEQNYPSEKLDHDIKSTPLTASDSTLIYSPIPDNAPINSPLPFLLMAAPPVNSRDIDQVYYLLIPEY